MAICTLTKSKAACAAIAATCAAVAAIVATLEYRDAQSRTQKQDQKIYGYAPSSIHSTQVKINNAVASPQTVKAGDKVRVTMDYSVRAPSGVNSVAVKESMVLKYDGESLRSLGERTMTRRLGGWGAEIEFNIPDGMPAGTYVITQRVEAGNSYDIRDVVFVVAA